MLNRNGDRNDKEQVLLPPHKKKESDNKQRWGFLYVKRGHVQYKVCVFFFFFFYESIQGMCWIILESQHVFYLKFLS